MNAIRWSVRFSSLIALSLVLGLVDARADQNSVALENATGGPFGAFSGSGQTIGMIEFDVPDTSHVYFVSQNFQMTNIYSGTSVWPSRALVNSHATEVAGVMVSTDATTIGVSTGAQIYAVAAGRFLTPDASDQGFQTNVLNAISFLVQQPNLHVINMSIGLDSVTNNGGIFGRTYNTSGTSVWERGMDYLVSSSSVSIVIAAGNEGNFITPTSVGGTNTLGEQAGAYNIITVGSVTNAPPGNPTNVWITSSRGYLSNGRSALDILAPGKAIMMPTTSPGLGGSATVTDSGTSFAAPAVAGVIARLDQVATGYLNSNNITDPRTIKAILLNSATKLPGWGQGSILGVTGGLQGVLTGGLTQVTQPLDPTQGAGLLNANGAYAQLVAGQKSPKIQQTGYVNIIGQYLDPLTGWDFNTVSLNLTNLYQLNTQAAGTLAITLDWYRDVGPTVAGTNSVLGLANLGLNLYSSADSDYTNTPLLAQSISTVDNIQHLWFTNVPAAYYEFGVSYNGYSSQGGSTPGNEPYSIAWSFTAVPEPSSLLLAGLGVITLWWGVKRQRRP
jgi:hypothetical protein